MPEAKCTRCGAGETSLAKRGEQRFDRPPGWTTAVVSAHPHVGAVLCPSCTREVTADLRRYADA